MDFNTTKYTTQEFRKVFNLQLGSPFQATSVCFFAISLITYLIPTAILEKQTCLLFLFPGQRRLRKLCFCCSQSRGNFCQPIYSCRPLFASDYHSLNSSRKTAMRFRLSFFRPTGRLSGLFAVVCYFKAAESYCDTVGWPIPSTRRRWTAFLCQLFLFCLLLFVCLPPLLVLFIIWAKLRKRRIQVFLLLRSMSNGNKPGKGGIFACLYTQPVMN